MTCLEPRMCRLLQSAMWWNERDFGRTINKKVLWSGKSKVAGPTFATCHGKGQSIYLRWHCKGHIEFYPSMKISGKFVLLHTRTHFVLRTLCAEHVESKDVKTSMIWPVTAKCEPLLMLVSDLWEGWLFMCHLCHFELNETSTTVLYMDAFEFSFRWFCKDL